MKARKKMAFKVEYWQTADGRTFPTRGEAERHEAEIAGRNRSGFPTAGGGEILLNDRKPLPAVARPVGIPLVWNAPGADPCDACPTNSKNGGSGQCCCTLSQRDKVYC